MCKVGNFVLIEVSSVYKKIYNKMMKGEGSEDRTVRRAGWSCCGAQNFCAALRRTLEILTAATRSLRFLCHRQRSVRSPQPAALRGKFTPFP